MVCNLLEHYLCTVDDVSAQTSCVISPNIANVIIAENIGRDVEFHCQCTDDNGMMITGTRWFHNGTSIPIQNVRSSSTTPYQINTTPITLYINQPFTTDHFHTGRYTCSPNSLSTASPPGDTIVLNAGSEFIYYLGDSDT